MKWQWTQRSLDEFLKSLDPDRETAGKQYEKIRTKLVRFFEWRSCPHAEEHADEALARMARKVVEGESIRDLHTFCYGIARLLCLECIKEQAKERSAIRCLQMFPADAEPDESLIRRIDCLQQCLQRLPHEQHELIIRYYRGDGGEQIRTRKQMAAQLAIPLNALRIKAHRIRESLHSCVRQCMRSSRRSE